MEPETQNLESGIWNLESGIWNLEFGIWNLEHGLTQESKSKFWPAIGVQWPLNSPRFTSVSSL